MPTAEELCYFGEFIEPNWFAQLDPANFKTWEDVYTFTFQYGLKMRTQCNNYQASSRILRNLMLWRLSR